MAHQPLTIVARFKAKPGMEARVKQDLLAMLAPSRSETGCLTYDLHINLADPSMFVLYEIWQDQASLNAHFTMPYSKQIAKAFEETLVEPYEMTLLQQISQ
ncbi:MAG: antibiotic biosynthesis monooxygenase [Lyngbya sp. HA4199-MV5]|jgi:quinol monooxygenase YgiN|nr:antibiotic biosynthesis monooxygenase [Lyngbya sp. HA4199-MV5]